MKTIEAYVEVYLDEWSDEELIKEMRDRGYVVMEEDPEEVRDLSKEELDILLDMVINAKPGTIERSIYDKLRKR